MSTNTKALKSRIKSVDSTLHLTKAMGLVASSKIRRATESMYHCRRYRAALDDLLSALAAEQECRRSPYMQLREGGRVGLVVIAGDRGLAGGYNNNVFHLADSLEPAQVFPIGKRAVDRYGEGVLSVEKFTLDESLALAQTLCVEFQNGELDRLGLVSSRYASVLSQEPTVRWLLPVLPPEEPGNAQGGAIFEPDVLTVLNAAVPEYIAGMIYCAARESLTCEMAARRNAMDAASKNAEEMMDRLQLQYNRARQGTITQEITEIVAGAGE